MKQLLGVLAFLCPFLSMCQSIPLKGKIINGDGEPVPGATITLKPSFITPANGGFASQTVANEAGEFTYTSFHVGDTLTVSATGYEPATELAIERGQVTIILRRRIGLLDEAVVIAYGKTTRRVSTGNVSRVSATEIARQPVSNPLSALDGRVSGLLVTQASGVPGAAVRIQLRGQSSLTQGSEPFFIIDGVPFAPGNGNTARLTSLLSTGGGLSPFNTISPADIESIEVLKDADATAIYGSRGAAGVVLITTKKGRAGKTVLNAMVSSGFSRVTRTAPLLNTQQYISLRREAFANDGITPTITNAPDLLVWDTARYTNFTDLLIGGTAPFTTAVASVSGGNAGTNFLLSGSFSREGTVFPGSLSDTKGSFLANLSHVPIGKPFSITLSLNYGLDRSNLTALGLAGLINLPPNTPALYTPAGKLAWEAGGAPFLNPLSFLQRTYTAASDNLVGRLQLSYTIAKGLALKMALGYNRLNVEELLLNPIAAQDPATAPRGTADFGFNRFRSWLVEPQLNYNFAWLGGRLEALVGGTLQQAQNNGLSIQGADYTSDALIRSLSAAPTVANRGNSFSEYRYAAGFGRLTYNHSGRYLLNGSARRDGSSRFGPGRRYATFGAVGAAWVFSNEAFVKKGLPFLSFGKLRGSWGTAGNDQIGDYQYLDAWGVVRAYGGASALAPAALFNDAYSWELTKKAELALDLGFFTDRLILSAVIFRNRSSNQLVQYTLPTQTGFTGITANLPALVQNQGVELEWRSTNIATSRFTWSTTANLTVPRNKLVVFPGLSTSAYASTYRIGQPLSVVYRLRSTGVDPATGLFTFSDKDGNGIIQTPADFEQSAWLGPRAYGGIGNTFMWGGFEAFILASFRQQRGTTYLGSLYAAGTMPGFAFNQPVYVAARWTRPGDEAAVQRPTTTTTSPAYAAGTRFASSSGIYGDASFWRIKTASLSYTLPRPLLHRWGFASLRFYLQGQNLFTFTAYQGADPENQTLLALPPLKTVVVGFQLTF